MALLALGGASARAAEYINNEQPAPESVDDLDGPLRRGFEEEEEEAPLLPRVARWLERFPVFFSDTRLDLKPRFYHFDRDENDGTRTRATTLGGSLAYESGWLKDTFRVGAEGFTSQPLRAKSDEDGTGLLKPGQEGFTVLGVAYGKLKWRDNVLTGYRQRLDLPYINGNDSRMVPNTFEGGLFSRSVGPWRYYVGHLTRIKLRDSDEFIRISRAAGLDQPTEDGLTVAGGAWTPSENFTLGGLTYFLWNVYNTAYLETDWVAKLGQGFGLRLGLQGTHQKSVGSELLGSFETWMLGSKVSVGYEGAIFTGAFNTVGKELAIQTPFGGYPGYLSSMLADFRQASETSWGFTLSYNFRRIPVLRDVSFYGRFVRGSGGNVGATGTPLPDRWEVDTTFDYRVKEGFLRGLWLRFRWADLRNDGAPDVTNLRVILRWELRLI